MRLCKTFYSNPYGRNTDFLLLSLMSPRLRASLGVVTTCTDLFKNSTDHITHTYTYPPPPPGASRPDVVPESATPQAAFGSKDSCSSESKSQKSLLFFCLFVRLFQTLQVALLFNLHLSEIQLRYLVLEWKGKMFVQRWPPRRRSGPVQKLIRSLSS